MSRVRKSNNESKKPPQMTLKEKRAAKKDKKDDRSLLSREVPAGRGTPRTRAGRA